MDNILEKARRGARIAPEEARSLLESPRWTAVVEAAHALRLARHAPDTVTYTTFRVINYTNVCDVDCRFCSFQEAPGSARGYTLGREEIAAKAREAQAVGVDQIFLQGGVNPALPLDYYLSILEVLSTECGAEVRGFSPVELLRLARKENMALGDLLEIMKRAGLRSVPGAGAEILTDRMRGILSPGKITPDEWCAVLAEAHQRGLPGSANIVIGSEETTDDIVEHLQRIRAVQDRTGGFFSFIPWVFQPQTKRFRVRHVQGWEYLRLLAVSRIFLDNVSHIEVSVLGMGKDLAELGLYAGADDINSIVLEENVLRSYGLKTKDEALRFIRQAGFEPKWRSMNYTLAPSATLAID